MMQNKSTNKNSSIGLNQKIQPIALFGIKIDPITMVRAVEVIFEWVNDNNKSCKFVVTPNVDHIVQLQSNTALLASYQKATLVLTDGKPVKWVANFLNKNIPETIPGSDLVPSIFEYAQINHKPVKVFLLGAMPGVAERAKRNINEQWPMVNIVGTLSPSFGFDQNESDCHAICEVVNASAADILIVGLGAPKQEVWVTNYAPKLKVNAALCVGATIDFLAKEKSRAPKWMRKYGLEWLHRIGSEPKRLIKRYIVGAIKFPIIVYREYRKRP